MDPRTGRLALLTRATVLAGLVVGVVACPAPRTPSEISARDRALAANDTSRQALASRNPGGGGSGPATSAAEAEESAARRTATRRAVAKARAAQDEAFDKRLDDLSFIEAYKTNDRNDSLKLYLSGRALGMLKRLNEAALEFEASALADPKNPWPYEGLGICYYRDKQVDRAIAQLKRSIDVDADLAESHYLLSSALESVGRTDEAIIEAENVIRLDDDPARGPLLLAALRLKRNEVNKAVDVLATATQRTPEHLELRLEYAKVLGLAGRAADAAAQLDLALAKGKIAPDELLRFAHMYRRADRFDRALAMLDRLIEEAPEDFWRMQPRGDVVDLHTRVRKEKEMGHRVDYSVDELIQILTAPHPDEEKRLLAFDALRQVPYYEVTQAYLAALKDKKSAQIRAQAVAEVERRVGAEAAQAFCYICQTDPDLRVRATTCRSLGRMGGENAEKTLLQSLLDAELAVREAANAALESMTGRILAPGGVGSLDEPGRKTLQLEWQRVLDDRRKTK